jgi:cardiolipin synthase (CMP-forming)
MSENKFLTVPNLLSLSRVLFIPLLLFFVNREMRLAFTIGYVLIAFTDYFDGKIARRFNQCTEIGKVMDSYCDLAFYLSTAYYIYKLYPLHLSKNLPMFIVLVCVIVLSLIVAMIKIGRPVMMHTWMLKLPSALITAYILFAYFVDTPIAFTVVVSVYMLGFIESIIIFIKYGDVDPDSVSMFNVTMNEPKEETV